MSPYPSHILAQDGFAFYHGVVCVQVHQVKHGRKGIEIPLKNISYI